MRLSRISDLQAFIAIVEKTSLTSAARPARPVAAIGQPLAGGRRAGRRGRTDTPDDAPFEPDGSRPCLLSAPQDRPRRYRRGEASGVRSKARAIRVACASAARPDLRPCIWFRQRPRSSKSIQRSKSKSAPTTVMSILSKTTSILPCISGRCPTPWPNPSVLPICGGYSLPHQATSPNTAGRNIRRIFQSINASFARRGSARISGRSRWTARSGRSRYPGVFAPMAPASSTKRQFMALELQSRRFGRSGHWSIGPGRSGARPICAAADSRSRHLVGDAGVAGENAHVHRFPEPATQGGAPVVERRALTPSSAPPARSPCGRSTAASRWA